VLEAVPTFYNDITVAIPGQTIVGGQIVLENYTVEGASTIGTFINLDLVGDHRLVDGSYELTREIDTEFDAVETVGEQIRVMGTFGGRGSSLAKRYTDTEAANYDALATNARDRYELLINLESQYRHVYRTVGIPYNWDGKSSTCLPSATRREMCVETNNAGFLRHSLCLGLGAGVYAPHPVPVLRLDNDLPIFGGWNYESGAVRYDEAEDSSALQYSPIAPTSWIRLDAGSDDYWLNASEAYGCREQRTGILGHDIEVASSLTEASYIRFFESSVSGSDMFDNFAVTMSMTMPNRVGYASWTGTTRPKRVKRIQVPGCHLWLAHTDAIWMLDPLDTNGSGYLARRNAGGTNWASYASAVTTSGLVQGTTADVQYFYPLRDDRAALAKMHAFHAAYYVRDERYAITWAMRDCGIYGGWKNSQGAVTPWPVVGDLIHYVIACGVTRTSDCPVTSVRYDHTTGITKWITSWAVGDWNA
jgi:hypothetical protein